MIKKLLALILLLPYPLIAAEAKDGNMEIFSNELHFFPNDNVAVFEGQVEAYQDNMELKSNRMVVFFEATKTKDHSPDIPKDSKIKQVDLEGDVVIITPKEKATSKRGQYNVDTGIATLYNDVELTQDGNWMRGEIFIHNRNTGESTMYTGQATKRVQGYFASEGEKDGE